MKRLVLVLLVGCAPNVRTVDCTKGECKPQDARTRGEPRLYVDPPFGATFSCVLLGCDTSETLIIENRGGGTLALPSVRLAVDASAEFSVSYATEEGAAVARPTPTTAYLLAGGEKLVVSVRYVPADGTADSTYLQIDWHNAAQAYESASIERVELPLATRVLGNAEASLQTPELSFGYVAPLAEGEQLVRLANSETSGGVLAVTGIEVSDSHFYVAPGFNPFANPGQEVSFPVRFAPDAEEAYEATLVIATNDPVQPTQVVTLRGTAVSGAKPTLVDLPLSLVDFGHVRIGEPARRVVRLRNEGSATAAFTAVISGSSAFTVAEPNVELAPLADFDVEVDLLATAPGPLTGTLQLDNLTVTLQGFCDAPTLSVTPSLSFGAMAQGWTSSTQTVVIANTGTGELVVEGLSFEVGSSAMVKRGPVSLLSLSPEDPPLEVPVWIEATALGAANATLLIESNAVEASVTRVDIVATVESCSDHCPVDNGVAECGSGACAVGSCEVGWHDSDLDSENGCECQEERGGNDVGGTCADGLDAGTLGDDCTDYPHEARRSGTLHSADDIDLYHFRARDEGGLCDPTTDSAAVIVEFVDAPEGMVFCVRDQQGGSGCGGYTNYYDPDLCRTTRYKNDASYGGDDNRDVTVWVMWRPDAAPVCGSYTLKMRGRD